MSDAVCCPPAAPRPKVAHPVSEIVGYEPAGSYEKVGNFDKVYVVSPFSVLLHMLMDPFLV